MCVIDHGRYAACVIDHAQSIILSHRTTGHWCTVQHGILSALQLVGATHRHTKRTNAVWLVRESVIWGLKAGVDWFVCYHALCHFAFEHYQLHCARKWVRGSTHAVVIWCKRVCLLVKLLLLWLFVLHWHGVFDILHLRHLWTSLVHEFGFVWAICRVVFVLRTFIDSYELLSQLLLHFPVHRANGSACVKLCTRLFVGLDGEYVAEWGPLICSLLYLHCACTTRRGLWWGHFHHQR